MELKWSYDPNAKLATANVNASIKYTTADGGQTVNKYVDGVLVKTMHKYGPDHKFSDSAPTGRHVENVKDEWMDEIEYLIQNHSLDLGQFVEGAYTGYRTKNGDIEALGEQRGMGVNNTTDKIGVNRLLAAANITEWWDWEVIAASTLESEVGRNYEWKRNLTTNEIVRVSSGNPPFPCCVYPEIHGPYPVTDLEADLAAYQGTLIDKSN